MMMKMRRMMMMMRMMLCLPAMAKAWTAGPARAFLAGWCLLALVLAACYTSKLTSLLVDVTPPPPFASLAQMVTLDHFRWGVIGGSSYTTFFRV